MPKIYLHLIRHAQGFHNLCLENHVLPDPLLTPLGEQQCHELSKAFPYTSQITHLIASPLRRTIYTTLLSFPSLLPSSSSKGLQTLALPSIQETSDLPCDTGSSIPVLESEFSSPTSKYDGAVNFSLLTPAWNSKKGVFSPAAKAIEARAMSARKYLRTLAESYLKEGQGEEVHMVVVTHGGFLHYFTEDFEGAVNDGTVGTGWHNTEFRSFNFVGEAEASKAVNGEAQGDDRASIVETQESRTRRRPGSIPLTKEEQLRLRAAAEKEWSKSGYQNKEDSDGEGEEEQVAKL
jgi:broad specificity phosphatase PhoE